MLSYTEFHSAICVPSVVGKAKQKAKLELGIAWPCGRRLSSLVSSAVGSARLAEDSVLFGRCLALWSVKARDSV